MLNSLIQIANKLKLNLTIATPNVLKPEEQLGNNITIDNDLMTATQDADVIMTDCFFSMGDQRDSQKEAMLMQYQVNQHVMNNARSDALFMHCLPAYRGYEVTAEVIDGKQSIVFEQAKNRLYVQQAIMLWCMGKLGQC